MREMWDKGVSMTVGTLSGPEEKYPQAEEVAVSPTDTTVSVLHAHPTVLTPHTTVTTSLS